MPIFKIQSFKNITGSDREWSNTYQVRAEFIEDVIAAITPLPNRERALHANNVTLSRVRISDSVPGTDVFVIVPFNLVGTAYDAAAFDTLPLFNTVRVDISVAGLGRPSRKFFRSPVGEQWIVDGNLDLTVVSLFNNQMNGLIADMAAGDCPLVDPDNQLWQTAVTKVAVQMRQLHRKRRRAVP